MSRFPETVKSTLLGIVADMAKDPSSFVRNPGTDFTRDRKINFENAVNMLLFMDAQSINQELLDYFLMVAPDIPTASAFVQQRAKLLPDAFQYIFDRFNSVFPPSSFYHGMLLVACDGTDASFAGTPADTEYFSSPGLSVKGTCSMHVCALYDLRGRRYLDAVVQPCRQKDEFHAFCSMVDSFPAGYAPSTIFIADRGFPSFNVFAHIMEKGSFFLIRSKDVNAKGLTGRLGLPKTGEFDINVSLNLVRKNTKAYRSLPGITKFIGKKVAFDPIPYGEVGVYPMQLRIVRILLPNGEYECLVTNLPAEKFPPEEIYRLYSMRWGEETSFRELKYAVGMLGFHCRKPEFVMQEIWARLVLYNFCETVTSHVVVTEKKGTKYDYQLNYTMAIQTCHKFLKLLPSDYQPDVEELIRKYLLPIRKGRNYKRRNSKYGHLISFLYRM